VTDCGHDCCAIADNPYHCHRSTPENCGPCREAAPEIDGLAEIVAAVVDRVAPEIPGLPTDPETLVDHVIAVTTGVHRRARTDPEVQRLSPRRRRTVLAARVGLALAFPQDLGTDPVG
jgi:hypothetical protein